MKLRSITSKAWIPALAATALFASAAQAASGFTINRFHLYTGPGHDFSRLETVPENARVRILGCTPGFTWCDVSWGGARGWIDAHGLQMYDRGRRVIVADAGPGLNLPVITYSSFDPESWRDDDQDRDGVPNGVDRDRDDDGVPNRADAYPDNPDGD